MRGVSGKRSGVGVSTEPASVQCFANGNQIKNHVETYIQWPFDPGLKQALRSQRTSHCTSLWRRITRPGASETTVGLMLLMTPFCFCCAFYIGRAHTKTGSLNGWLAKKRGSPGKVPWLPHCLSFHSVPSRLQSEARLWGKKVSLSPPSPRSIPGPLQPALMRLCDMHG